MVRLLTSALWLTVLKHAAANVFVVPGPTASADLTGPGNLVGRDDGETKELSLDLENDMILDIGDDDNHISIECLECRVDGSIMHTFDVAAVIIPVEPILVSFPEDTVIYIDLEIDIAVADKYTVNLFSLLPGTDITIGFNFFIDLVIELDALVQIEGGWQITIPAGSYVIFNMEGNVVDSNMGGLQTQDIEWQTDVDVSLKLDLQFRAEFGLDAVVDFNAGVFINLEGILDLHASTTDTCGLETTEEFNINIGAYAAVGIVTDDATVGFNPQTTTTLSSWDWNQCWLTNSQTSDITTISSVVPNEPITSIESTWAVVPNTPITSISSTWAVVPNTPTPSPAISTQTARPTSSSDRKPSSALGTNSTITHTGMARPTATSFTLVRTGWNTTNPAASQEIHTSTVQATHTYTVFHCAASIINCPASWRQQTVIYKTVDLYTTVCPVGETQVPQTAAATTTRKHRAPATTNTMAMTALPKPIINVFTPGAGLELPAVPTVTSSIHLTAGAVSSAPSPFSGASTSGQVANGEGTKTKAVQEALATGGTSAPPVGSANATASTSPTASFVSGAGKRRVPVSVGLSVAVLGLFMML